MARRYKTDQFQLYDTKYVALKNMSQVLGRVETGSVHNIMFDKKGCESYRYELIGNETGHYDRNGERKIAVIPGIKNALEYLQEEFAMYCEDQENLGYEVPEEMPIEMLNKRLSLEARLDVANEELAKIEEKLKTFTQAEQEKSDSEVLRYGLLGSCQLCNGVCCEADGQIVERKDIDDKTLIIKDKRSPYNGMSLKDYRKLSAKWKEDRKIADEQEYEKIKAEANRRGVPVPGGYSSYGNVIPKDQLPEFPADYKNHLKPELQRTK